MTASRLGVPMLPVALLRIAVAREVARSSLRGVARAVALSPNGVRDFLGGAIPRSSTRAKLERWLGSKTAVTRPPNIGQFVRLVNHLAADLSPQQAVRLGSDIAGVLFGAYVARQLPPPRWVRELIRHYRPPDTGEVA